MSFIERDQLPHGLLVVQPPRHQPLQEGTMLGPYRVVSLLASGGMGEVYRARDERLERDVALKVLPSTLTNDREGVERFAQEAKAASALNHPHIVAIYEIGTARPSPVVQAINAKERLESPQLHYIAMELVEGVTIREFLGTKPPLGRRLEVMAQTAEGLGKAHAVGIVHRDLKPENVMVSAEGYAKIVDFGLVKLVEPASGWNPLGADSPTMRAITQQGALIGTAGYMSPEHILGKPVDQRSDIFSFGCMLHEAVTGENPFKGDSFVDTLYDVLHGTPPPVTWADPMIEHELQRIVGKCLVKERENRYQSIRDVALDLVALRRELDAPVPPETAPSADVGERRPPTSARTVAVTTAAAAAVALVALVGGWLKQSAPAEPLRRAATQRLTTSGNVGFLAVSPDGRFAAYTVHDEAKGQGIRLLQFATGSSIDIVKQEPRVHYAGLAFTGDSNHLLATRYDGSIYGQLVELPLLGGPARRLVHDADTPAAVSPDGTRIAVVRNVLEKGESHLLTARRDGSGERVLARLPMPKGAASPAWSPDGTRIAVAHRDRIVMFEAGTGRRTDVPRGDWHGLVRGLAWMPGGRSLIVSASDDRTAGRFQLFEVNAETGAVRSLTDDEDDYAQARPAGESIAAVRTRSQASLWSVAPGAGAEPVTRGIGSSDGLRGAAWTAEGRIVYSSSSGGEVDLWIANRDGSAARQLTHDGRIESDPRVTRDGRLLIYTSASRGSSEIRRMNLDGSDARPIASAPILFGYALTPDSGHVVYAARDAGDRSSLMAVPVGGGPPRRIAATGVFVRTLDVTADGGTVVFSALDENAVKLFRVPFPGGPVTRLAEGRALGATLSPDGQEVAWTADLEEMSPGVMVAPVAGGAPRVLDFAGRGHRWSPDGRAMLFIRREGRSENLFAQPLDGGEAKRLTSFGDGFIANFAWSPDGSRLLVTQFVLARDVVVLGTTRPA